MDMNNKKSLYIIYPVVNVEEEEELEKLVEEQESHEAVKKYEAELEVIGYTNIP